MPNDFHFFREIEVDLARKAHIRIGTVNDSRSILEAIKDATAKRIRNGKNEWPDTIALCCVGCHKAVPKEREIRTAVERDTLLYVCTHPPGADVFLNGKRLGTFDGLFCVKPGIGELVVALDEYKIVTKQVTIRAARIERGKLSLERKKTWKSP